jgi:hypothetical protein
MEENKLLITAKQCLSVISTSTAKDAEIQMLINAGIADLERQGINANSTNDLVKAAIIMFVKSNFGNTDIKEKELAQKTYSLLCSNLGLSEEYKESDSNA